MLCVETLRNRSTRIIELCRLIPRKSWCNLAMPEIAEKRQAESGLDIEAADAMGEGAKKPKLEEAVTDKPAEGINTAAKWKLKKFAMCLAYCGKGYLGLQRNPGFKTIEEDLLTACLKAGFLTEDSFNSPKAISFQRAARTDKGVSAARQILSLKLPTKKGSPEEMVERINEHLVDQIRVIGLKRVTQNFNSKNNADARTYLYICPTFAFTPTDQAVNDSFRLPPDLVDEINRVLQIFKGSHNFHNFTSGKVFGDPSAKRYIIEAECGLPFMVNELEYVQFRIKGQSFMLHQIRKMVGTIIGIMRGYTTAAFITRAFGPEKLEVPKAPALGLMLDTVHYTRYDNRYGGDGSHEPITWEEHQDVVHSFKSKQILPNIWDTEEKDESMIMWLEELNFCSFDLARIHEELPKTIPDAPEDEAHSDDEDEDEEEEPSRQ